MVHVNVHKFRINPKTGASEMYEVKPYRLYQALGRPDVYLQEGKYTYANGEPVKEAALRAYGLSLPSEFSTKGIPDKMEPPAEVKETIKKYQKQSLEEQVVNILGGSGNKKKGVR